MNIAEYVNMPLESLIDRTMPSFLSLCRQVGKTPDETFAMLEEAFGTARQAGALRQNGDALLFELTGVATIRLAPNTNTGSASPLYIRYVLAQNAARAPISESLKAELYSLLLGRYPAGKVINMASVCIMLRDEGYDRTTLGVAQMKDAFAQLGDFAELVTISAGPPPVMGVILRRCGKYPSAAPAPGAASDTAPQRVIASVSFESTSSQAGAAPEPAALIGGKTMAEYAEEPLRALVNLGMPSLRSMAKLMRIEPGELLARLETAYNAAREQGTLRVEEREISFIFEGRTAVRLVPNTTPGAPTPLYLFQEIAPGVSTISEEMKAGLYSFFTRRYKPGVPLNMAAVSADMAAEGYTKERLGVLQMRDAIRQLAEFVEMKPLPGTEPPVAGLVLHVCGKYSQSAQAVPAQSAAAEACAAPEPAERFAEPKPAERPIPETMGSDIFVPMSVSNRITYLMTGVRGAAPDRSLLELIRAGYERAYREGAIQRRQEAWYFDTGLKGAGGEDIIVSFRAQQQEGRTGWFVNWAGFDEVDSNPGGALASFAYLGNWTSFAGAIAASALPEKWGFSDDPNDYSILIRYIRYTFYRLSKENKVLISGDGTFAAFNTGLVTKNYEELYCCFVPNADPKCRSAWNFAGLCTAGARGLGKRLVDSFNPLPAPPSYLSRKEDLLYDIDRDLILDKYHIAVDNIHRLPMDFLEEIFYDSAAARVILDGIKAPSSTPLPARFAPLRDFVDNNDRYFRRICARVDAAVEIAKKRVRWNFKTALPCFFPTRNVMSLMLPLALLKDERVDVALVVELTQSGNYQGQTILPLREAYLDARLLCRPDSDWLDPGVSAAADDYALEEEPD